MQCTTLHRRGERLFSPFIVATLSRRFLRVRIRMMEELYMASHPVRQAGIPSILPNPIHPFHSKEVFVCLPVLNESTSVRGSFLKSGLCFDLHGCMEEVGRSAPIIHRALSASSACSTYGNRGPINVSRRGAALEDSLPQHTYKSKNFALILLFHYLIRGSFMFNIPYKGYI